MVGLLRPVIDSFGELRRSRASGQKQPSAALLQVTASGWGLSFTSGLSMTAVYREQPLSIRRN